MAQSNFSNLDKKEKLSRLTQLGKTRAMVTVWIKGQKEKKTLMPLEFNADREEMQIDSKGDLFPLKTSLLCSFDVRGMSFFSQVTTNVSVNGQLVLEFSGDLFKFERRASYRLMTFPIYQVFAEFKMSEAYEESGAKVIDIKNRLSQTGLFKNFVKLVEDTNEDQDLSKLVYRVQDFSVTGMGLLVTDVEAKFFEKDLVYKDVVVRFSDETYVLPEVLVVYVMDYISSEKGQKKYKIGLHFPNLPVSVDDQLGKQINKLLREIDFNKDFENFLK